MFEYILKLFKAKHIKSLNFFVFYLANNKDYVKIFIEPCIQVSVLRKVSYLAYKFAS